MSPDVLRRPRCYLISIKQWQLRRGCTYKEEYIDGVHDVLNTLDTTARFLLQSRHLQCPRVRFRLSGKTKQIMVQGFLSCHGSLQSALLRPWHSRFKSPFLMWNCPWGNDLLTVTWYNILGVLLSMFMTWVNIRIPTSCVSVFKLGWVFVVFSRLTQ